MLSVFYWLYINDKVEAGFLELPVFSVQLRYFCDVAIGPIRFELTYTATSIQHTVLLIIIQENETLFNSSAFPSQPFNGKSPW